MICLVGVGPTGEFPDGKISDDDKGELSVAFVEDGNVLKMHFGYEIDWLGLDPVLARHLGEKFLKFAEKHGA